jgi:hypothetical protein
MYQTKHSRLRANRNLALDLLRVFSEYDLNVIPREQNQFIDALATSASVFNIPSLPNKRYEIKVRHRPAVPDNIKHWQVFEDDKQVERFLLMSDKFANTNLNGEHCGDEDECTKPHSDDDPFQNQIMGRNIIQLKNNIILKGLVPLEKLFDENDVAKNPKIIASAEDMEDCNIKTEAEPKMVNLSKHLSPEVKKDYIKLMKVFPDVFAWSYNDMKVYDTKVIQHFIPLKEYQNPFKKNLRWINPFLFSLIKKEVKNIFDTKIVVSLRFSKWVANLVPVIKKSDEIRLCVDF